MLNTRQKVELLQTYRDEYDLKVLVETGLYNGRGSGMEVSGVDVYVAIDWQPDNVHAARTALEGRHAAVILGDSAFALPIALREIKEPALFWLDAHAIDDDPDSWPDCPLLVELDAITQHRHDNELEHVVLIDDLRQLGQLRGAPTLDELREHAGRRWRIVDEADDVMRLLP